MNALRGRDVVDARDREHDPRLDVAHEIEPKNLADQILLLQRATALMGTAQKSCFSGATRLIFESMQFRVYQNTFIFPRHNCQRTLITIQGFSLGVECMTAELAE
jgi:hypothetical protein